MRRFIQLSLITAVLAIGSAGRAQPHGGMPGQGPHFAPATLDDKSEAGTLSILVVTDRLESPQANVKVSVEAKGKSPLTGRTDAGGRLQFTALPQDTEYQVTVEQAEGLLKSESFRMSADKGVSVVLSRKPLVDRVITLA